MTIPQRLWRLWLDDPQPDEFARYETEWRRLHPTWQVTTVLHTADLPPLRPSTQQIVDNAAQIMPGDWKRLIADAVRLELLYQLGGVYVDCDCHPLRPFDDLLDPPGGAFAARSSWRTPSGLAPITNAVMGAEPGHPFIDRLLTDLPDAIERYAGQSLARVAGPWHVERTYEAMDDPQLHLYPTEHFYPLVPTNRSAPVDLDGAYCIHQWNSQLRRRGKGLG